MTDAPVTVSERQLHSESAVALRSLIERGRTTAEAITRDCLKRIEAREGDVHAWQFIDPALAIAQARSRDASGKKGPLQGVPIGIKDLIDTADMPTTYGSPIYADHRPRVDATCVARLRDAGAVIIGKTVTTEFAISFRDGVTRNPLALDRTPGGSSSGSAAAVADLMVPLAVGTQSGGSVLRPASYCGIYGFKPTFGAISRNGVRPLSPSLDTVGIFGRSVADIRMLAAVLVGSDPLDPTTKIAPIDVTLRPLRRPRIAYMHPGWLPAAERYVWSALDTLVQRLRASGAEVTAVDLPPSFEGLVAAARVVLEFEFAREMATLDERAEARIGEGVSDVLEAGRRRTREEYAGALALADACRTDLARILAPFDVALTPVATGQAPAHGTTGDPVFCRAWTLLGAPSISVPGLFGPSSLPIGFQLTGKLGDDGVVLQIAEWSSR